MFRFVALHPDHALETQLLRHKQKAFDAAGPQLYLDHHPHSTVYLADYEGEPNLLASLEGVLRSTPPIPVRVIGWHYFLGDALTGFNTLVYSLHPEDIVKLRKLQMRIVEAIAPLRNKEKTHERYAARWDSLAPNQQHAVEVYGFPFLGDGWHPHFTIASIRPADWSTVLQSLENDPPEGTFTCSALAEYSLETPMPKLERKGAFEG